MKYIHYCRKSTDDDEHQVLSLESQDRENVRRFGNDPDIEIIGTLIESKSAKYPGRAQFNEMLDRIERGKADGIIAWDPDRLARNSVDGGRIIYLLDTGKLKDLKFSTYTFENTAQGKFMLQIIFANAKYHVDALSNNVKRGNRTKVENGWLPNAAPVGYLNRREEGVLPIVPDPERFALVRRLFEIAMTRAFTVPQLREEARRWGLTTRARKRRGGSPVSISGLYRVLTNPFYAGILEWEGHSYPGKHEAMLTVAEFEAVQIALGRKVAPRAKHHTWTYTGLFLCVCGLSITASEIRNRFGTKYIYYHCTRRRGGEYCREPYLRLPQLEATLRQFVAELTLSSNLHEWALQKVRGDAASAESVMKVKRAALERGRAGNEIAMRNLRHLRTREQITEAEFVEDRAALEKERIGLDQELQRLGPENALEPEQYFVSFSVHALSWWDEGDEEIRKIIVKTAGLNPVMAGGELKIDAAFPFRRWKNPADLSELCTALNDVRTLDAAALADFVVAIRELEERRQRIGGNLTA
jgi:site-specific DNA recombinase